MQRGASRGYAYWCNLCHSARQKELGHPHETKYRIAQSVGNREQYLSYFKQNYKLNKTQRLLTGAAWKTENRLRNLTIVGARRKRRKEAQPAWADITLIQLVYSKAQSISIETGMLHEVDHYYPINGKTVCGLHVANNLQVITKQENLEKGNKHPDDFYST